MRMTDRWVEGVLVERSNRFLAVVRLPSGDTVEAYVPNTARLTGLLEPGARVIMVSVSHPARKTRFTLTRVWDGTWVSLEASRAPVLLADWLGDHPLDGFGEVADLHREVALGRHRIDLVAGTPAGEVWLEVKSGSRGVGGDALLSGTPSARGRRHLEALAELVAEGTPAAVAFVVQRADVDRFVVGGDADRTWIEAVRSARRSGVQILAYRCAVTPAMVHIDRELPVAWAE